MSTGAQLSAAQFTVLGVANKFATILFDHVVKVRSHTTVVGSLFLVCTILASLLYGVVTNAAQRQRESGVFSLHRSRAHDDGEDEGEDKGEDKGKGGRGARAGGEIRDCGSWEQNAIELHSLLEAASPRSALSTPGNVTPRAYKFFATDVEEQAAQDGGVAAAQGASEARAERRTIETRLGAVTAELAALRRAMKTYEKGTRSPL